MDTKKQLKKLEQDYFNMPIPAKLSTVVENAIEKEAKLTYITRKKERKLNLMKKTIKTAVVSAAAVAVFTLTINVSPVFAQTLSDIPVVGDLIKVLTFKQYNVEEKDSVAHIDVPQIEGLSNKELQNNLNEELAQKGEESYQKFIEQVKVLEGIEGETAKVALDVTYEVLTDTEDTFVLKIIETQIQASANVQTKFYVIDKKTEKIVTLKDLFETKNYIIRISENIIKQMEEQMVADENKVYWVHDEMVENFTSIVEDQQFYINKQGKIVICFDKYDVAPGYMGTSEFIIPTEAIEDLLVKNNMIK